MFNDWLTIGSFTIHGYGVMIAIGILVAFWLAEKEAKRKGLDSSQVDNIGFTCLITGYLGSKTLYCLTNWNAFIQNPTKYLGSEGWVVYGGLLGGILGAVLYCKFKKLSFKDYANVIFPEIALAQAFGRIGCFLAGCCYGKETTSVLGVVFPEGSLAPSGVKLIPTQLLFSFGDFILFYILYKNMREGKHPEYNIGIYLMLYSIGRFFLEFLRGDSARGFIGPLSTSQVIAIPMFIGGIIALLIAKKFANKETVQ